jgi:hypothetical protein
MLAIADNANDLGYAWPGEATLARKIRLSKRQVQRLVHDLADEGDELAVIWGGSAARNTNKYYVLVGRTPGEIKTTLRHVSEQNEKRHAQAPLPSPESRAEGMGDKMSPGVMGDISGRMGDKKSGMGDIFEGMGDTAVSLEPSLIEPSLTEPSSTEPPPSPRVTVSLGPAHLNRHVVGDGAGHYSYLSALLDDLDIHGRKRREIERKKPRADFVLAHGLYAASRGKGAGWVIVETLAGAVPPSDFLTFARLSPEEWSALWRGSARGEWSTCPPQLYQARGEWLRAFEGVFEGEPFTERPVVEKPELPIEPPGPVIGDPWDAALSGMEFKAKGLTPAEDAARRALERMEHGHD